MAHGRLTAGAAAEPVGGGGLTVRRIPAKALEDMTAKANPRTARKTAKFGDNLDFMTLYGKSGYRGVKLFVLNMRKKLKPI
jgi:hypothetical protein